MKLSVQAFSLPKEGNAVEEYEDAFDYSLVERRFAIADGATESSFANVWAKSLVQKFIAAPPSEFPVSSCDFEGWLEPLQLAWQEGINWDSLPWFASEKAQAGAFSTFLGIDFVEGEKLAEPSQERTSSELRWKAIAIGDSCLFHVRANSLLAAFPIKLAEQFSNSPSLLSSKPNNNHQIWEQVCFLEGGCEHNDLFFLASDALAQWFLKQYEGGVKPWEFISDIQAQEHFEAFMTQLRKERLIRNDDITLLALQTCQDETFEIPGGKQKTTRRGHRLSRYISALRLKKLRCFWPV